MRGYLCELTNESVVMDKYDDGGSNAVETRDRASRRDALRRRDEVCKGEGEKTILVVYTRISRNTKIRSLVDGQSKVPMITVLLSNS